MLWYSLNLGLLSIGSLCTEGKYRMRTLSILTIKKGSYLYIREVSKIGKRGGYITKTGVVVQLELEQG